MNRNLPFKPKAFWVLFFISVVLTFNKSSAQNSLYAANVKFQPQADRVQNPTTVSLKDAFQQLQKQLNISLIYNPSDVVDLTVPNSDLESAIASKSVDRLLKETQLAAHKISDNVYVIKSKNAKPNINVPKTGFITPETQGTTPTTAPQ